MATSRTNRILEIIWIITGMLCLAAGLRYFILNGYSNRLLLFLLMAVISFLYAWFRHSQRKKS
jgi:hypothetical protein